MLRADTGTLAQAIFIVRFGANPPTTTPAHATTTNPIFAVFRWLGKQRLVKLKRERTSPPPRAAAGSFPGDSGQAAMTGLGVTLALPLKIPPH